MIKCPSVARDAEDRVRLDALREAAQSGIAEIEAGRCRCFTSAEALEQHLAELMQSMLSEEAGLRPRS